MNKYLIYPILFFLIFINSCADIDEPESFFLPIESLTVSSGENLLSDDIAKAAYEYYKRPYADAPDDFVQAKFDKVNYKVFRPNHGLLHGLRKAALAIHSAVILSTTNSLLAPWINASTDPKSSSYNPNFIQQLAYGLLMLRTGRGSEKNDKYKEYSYLSANYFLNEAKKSGLFPRQKDIDDFVFAFQTIGDLPKCFDKVGEQYVYTQARGCTIDRLNLYNFFYGAHHLDLRRMVGFKKPEILGNIAQYFGLFKDNKPDSNAEAIKKLWQLSGEYLRITGDRDMDGTPPNHRLYKKPFYLLSNNPGAARKAVEDVFKASIAPTPTKAAPIAAPALKPQPSPVPVAIPPMPAEAPTPLAVQVITPPANCNDIWYGYRFRPAIAAASNVYPADILQKAKSLRFSAGTQVPWSFKAIPAKGKGLFSLADVVPDRIYEKATDKKFVKMYHGTTSDLFDTFKSGAPIRFELGKGALGTGFYLTTNLNEAKHYAWERLQTRKQFDKNIKGMVLVYGVEVNNRVKGKYAANIPLSDDKTGESLDPEIYFKRNGLLYNQFVFFKNAAVFLKLFAIIVLLDGFARSKGINDFDGLLEKAALPTSPEFYCNPAEAN